MTILSWLFRSTQNKNNQNITPNNIINDSEDEKDNDQKEFEIEQKQIEDEEEEKEEEEEEKQKEKEKDEDYNYFDTSYFNNNNNNKNNNNDNNNNNYSFNNNLINHLKSNFNDNQANEIVISFDTTGKMFSYFIEFKNQLDNILSILFKRLPTLKIAIMAHGDYCDDSRQTSYFNRSISILPFTNNIEEIKSFVNSIERTNGDDAPECYEYSMRKARELPWSIYSKKSFIIIGDDVPHPPSYTDQHFYWRNELHYLTKIGIKVYGVQCHNNSHAKLFYEELATLSNGRYVHLKDSKDIGDLIVLIAFRENVNKNFLKNNLYEIIGKGDEVGVGGVSPLKEKKKQIKEKFHQLFSNIFTRERDSSINIRFPWWDISFDVSPNPRYMWDSDSKLFVENIISIQNECPIGIPTSLVSPITIEKSSSSTTVTPSSSYGNLFKMTSSPNKSINNSGDNLNFSLDINDLQQQQQPQPQSIEVVVPINSSSLVSSCTTLHQENNFIKTITKPRYPFTSFCLNSSLINTPFNYNNNNNNNISNINNNNNNNNSLIHSNTSFSKAGMSITMDKPKSIFKNSNGGAHLQPQRILTPSRKRKTPEEERNDQLQQQQQLLQQTQQTPQQTSQQEFVINGSTIGSTKNMNLISEFIKEQLNLDLTNANTPIKVKKTIKTTTSKDNNNNKKIITSSPVNTTSSTTSSTPNSTTSTISSTVTTTTLIHKNDESHPKKFQRNLYSTSVHSHYNSPTSSSSSPSISSNNSNIENNENIIDTDSVVVVADDNNDDDDSQATTASDCSSGGGGGGGKNENNNKDTQIELKDGNLKKTPFVVFDPSTNFPIIPKSITQTTTTTTTTTTTSLLT
ncbi:hypothetical protein ACTFIW_002112 [Dictyostelium discoideum]